MFLDPDRHLDDLDLLNRLRRMVGCIQPATTTRTRGQRVLVDGVKLLRSKCGAFMLGMPWLPSNPPSVKDGWRFGGLGGLDKIT